MQSFTIEITIDEEGQTTGEVKGIQGPSCSDISKFLDELGEVVEDRPTPDYYRQARVGARVQLGGSRRR